MLETDIDISDRAGRPEKPSAYKVLVYASAAVWICGMLSALIAFGTFRTEAPPGSMDHAVRCTLGFAIGAPLAICLCRLMAGKLWSVPLCIIVSSLTALMFIGISINMAGYLDVPGASWEMPGLAPYSDPATIYYWTDRYVRGYEMPGCMSMGPLMFYGVFFRVFGTGLLAPLIFNATCMALSVTACGVICARLVEGDRIQRKAWAGALLMAMIPSIPYYGSILMKEAPVTLGFTLMSLPLAGIYTGRFKIRDLAWGGAGTVLLMALKPHTGYLLCAGAILCLVNARRRQLGSKACAYNGTLATLLLSLAIVAGGRPGRSDSDFLLLDSSRAQESEKSMLHHEAVGNYDSLVTGYYAKSPVEKAAYLPVAAAAQYFPPFPWNYTRDTYLARFVPVAHLSFLWYMVGGMVLAWFVLCMPFRDKAGGLRLWALFWAGCYLGVAYMSAGSVARYHLPFMALCVPLALDLLTKVIRGGISRKKASVFGAIYITLLITGLALAYNFLV